MSAKNHPEQPPTVEASDLLAVPAGVHQFLSITFGRTVPEELVAGWIREGRLPVREMLRQRWATVADVMRCTEVRS